MSMFETEKNKAYPVFINGKFTIYGVVRTFEADVTKSWKADSSRKTMQNYFEKIIFPQMSDRPLEDWSYNVVLDFLDSLRKSQPGGAAPDGGVTYDDHTVDNNIRNCLSKVFETADAHGICQDIFWLEDAKKDLSEKGTESRLPKSIESVSMEIALCGEIMESPEEHGRTIGLMLMYIFGFRNQEACAACFKNIIQIDGRYYICSHSKYDSKDVYIHVGGKTYNAYRVLPIPPKVLDFLMVRKQSIQRKIDSGEITLEPKSMISSVDQMPIGCYGSLVNGVYQEEYTKFCSPGTLTDEGRRIFHKINFDGVEYLKMQQAMNRNVDELFCGSVRDPSAYLLRRHFADTLRNLHLSEDDREYALGHCLDGTYSRSDYMNPDMLNPIYDRILLRPLYMYGSQTPVNREDIEKALTVHPNEDPKNLHKAIIEGPSSGGNLRVTILRNEAYDPLTIQVEDSEDQGSTITKHVHISHIQTRDLSKESSHHKEPIEADITSLYLKDFGIE